MYVYIPKFFTSVTCDGYIVVKIVESLSSKLEGKFPSHKVLDAFGIIYPQYYVQEGANTSFQKHLAILK
jgi:hypothetical protein